MDAIGIGECTVRGVIERAGPWRRPEDYFPDAPAERLAARLEELAPSLYDRASGLLYTTYQSFLVRTPRHTVLIDTCVGEDKPGRWPQLGAYPKRPWRDNLAAAGVTPADIDMVFCTHLHVDHVGWNTRLENGRWVPTFPNARYVFSRREFAHWEAETAKAPDPSGPHFADSVLPVVEAGQALLVDDDAEIDETLSLAPSPGHTPGHVCVNLASAGRRALFTGDVMHHALQCLEPDWSTRFCWDPALSARTRRAILEDCADTDTIVLPTHFPAPTAGRVVSARDAAFRFRFLEA